MKTIVLVILVLVVTSMSLLRSQFNLNKYAYEEIKVD